MMWLACARASFFVVVFGREGPRVVGVHTPRLHPTHTAPFSSVVVVRFSLARFSLYMLISLFMSIDCRAGLGLQRG